MTLSNWEENGWLKVEPTSRLEIVTLSSCSFGLTLSSRFNAP